MTHEELTQMMIEAGEHYDFTLVDTCRRALNGDEVALATCEELVAEARAAADERAREDAGTRCYTMTCDSGTVVLVRATSADAAERAWDEDVDRGDAEPRLSGTTERASRADIRRCVEMGHDYR